MTNFIAIDGRLTEDPQLKFIQSGAAVVEVNVAHNERKFDKATNTWVDGDTTFIRASLWREHAENVASSLTKGMRVLIVGALKQESWEQDGQKRSTLKIQAESITPVLKWATANVTKVAKGTSQTPHAASGNQGDPWASAPADTEVPF